MLACTVASSFLVFILMVLAVWALVFKAQQKTKLK
jgi:hypothetical protein